MKNFLTIFFCQTFFLSSAVMTAHAQDASSAEYMRGKILSAQDAAGTLTALPMGIALDLEDDWYIYWRMPGDGGIATSFDWTKSNNVADVKISWPVPQRIEVAGMNSFGYTDDVVFPVEVVPEKPGESITLTIKVHAVACHDICVPQEITMTRVLPAHDPAGTAEKSLIEDARTKIPVRDDSKGLRVETAVLGKDSIAVPVYAADGIGDDADLIVETENSLLTKKPEIIRDTDDKTRAVLKVSAPEGVDLTKELFGRKTGILVLNGGASVEKDFTF